jgi:hypothetical protein
VSSHVRSITESSQQPCGANWQALCGYELLIGKQPNADDEMLHSCEADRCATALHVCQRHLGPRRQVTRPANAPRFDTHGLYEGSQRGKRRLGRDY